MESEGDLDEMDERAENSVRIIKATKLLEDLNSTKNDCFICRLQKSFAAQLWGGFKAAKLELMRDCSTCERQEMVVCFTKFVGFEEHLQQRHPPMGSVSL